MITIDSKRKFEISTRQVKIRNSCAYPRREERRIPANF